MKVLWITNALLPEAISLLAKAEEIKGTGGWVLGLADTLQSREYIELHIAAISDLVQNLATVKGEHITYHAIPCGKGDTKYNKQYEEYFREICKEIKPDVVHIHGTEFPHSLAALRACGAEKTVVSLQGLVSVIARYNNGGISKWDAFKNLTFHDIVRGGIICHQKRMHKSGEYETAVIKECNYVIGRTSFDRAHTWALNPNAHYFHCGELLRQDFYDKKGWDYEHCIPHSIFMSQSAFPIKGVHKVIEALDIVKKIYPDVTLRVAGHDLTYREGGWRGKIRITSYGKIVRNLIKEKALVNSVFFTGELNAKGMIGEYLKSNVFICPSSIENSSNSLAEAQVLGVPCIASYAGGIPDMMKGYEDYLYRFDDVEMLAYKICQIFSVREGIDNNSMRQMALRRHDKVTVVNDLLMAYNSIVNR